MATSAEIDHHFDKPLVGRVTAKLNVRAAAARSASRVDRLTPGQEISIGGWVHGEAFLGNDRWLQLSGRSQFVWSGGVNVDLAPLTVDVADMLAVQRRSDGSILPLSADALATLYGDLQPVEIAPRGAVRIGAPNWEADNLALLRHAALDPIAPRGLRVHRQAAPRFTAVLDAIVERRLSALLLTCGGTFVPRHIGWNPTKPLSSHSWGVAIDLNERWNSMGSAPALPGQTGCLRELVPLFAEQGFAWGGHFSTGADGMHFELALQRL